MSRCVHLHDQGVRCISEAMEGGAFCEDHGQVAHGVEALGDHPLRKLVLRLVAAILLLILLIPFYESVRALYLAHPSRSREAR